MFNLILGILAWTFVCVYVTIMLTISHKKEIRRIRENYARAMESIRVIRLNQDDQEEDQEPINWQRNGF